MDKYTEIKKLIEQGKSKKAFHLGIDLLGIEETVEFFVKNEISRTPNFIPSEYADGSGTVKAQVEVIHRQVMLQIKVEQCIFVKEEMVDVSLEECARKCLFHILNDRIYKEINKLESQRCEAHRLANEARSNTENIEIPKGGFWHMFAPSKYERHIEDSRQLSKKIEQKRKLLHH